VAKIVKRTYKKKIKSKKHNPYQLSLSTGILFDLATNPSVLLLYLTLRRFARNNYGSFKDLLPKLSSHQRYNLLPQLVYDYKLTTFTKIKNHRKVAAKYYSNRFIKVPNYIDNRNKLTAFIIATAETQILKTKYDSYRIHPKNKEVDQVQGNEIKTSHARRFYTNFISYAGSVTRERIREITGLSFQLISKYRKLSLNNYDPLLVTIAPWMDEQSTFLSHCNYFIKYNPRSISTRIHMFFVFNG